MSGPGAGVPDEEVLPAAPDGWSARRPGPDDAEELARLLREHERRGRGWAGASAQDLLVEVAPPGTRTRDNVVLTDGSGAVRGWASAHDRAAGRLVLTVLVDHALADEAADEVAGWLFDWATGAAGRVGRERGVPTQQVDSGAFAGDGRQHRWLERAGFRRVRTWWQMSRPVTPEEAALEAEIRDGVRIRLVEQQDGAMPSEEDLRTVHDVLETAFADHFNSHEETFEEFVARLREDPGHRWDHWWVAELTDGPRPEPAGAVVASVTAGAAGTPDGSYVEYLGVLQGARGRGVARSLLRTVIADAAARGRDRVGLEVDADSPTGADGLYLAMGWQTRFVTESWHRDVDLAAGAPRRTAP